MSVRLTRISSSDQYHSTSSRLKRGSPARTLSTLLLRQDGHEQSRFLHALDIKFPPFAHVCFRLSPRSALCTLSGSGLRVTMQPDQARPTVREFAPHRCYLAHDRHLIDSVDFRLLPLVLPTQSERRDHLMVSSFVCQRVVVTTRSRLASRRIPRFRSPCASRRLYLCAMLLHVGSFYIERCFISFSLSCSVCLVFLTKSKIAI